MMRQLGINVRVTCNKTEILSKLKENRDLHSRLVAEARKGYIAHAQEALIVKLNKLKQGLVTELAFSLSVPRDFTSAYDTVIGMFEAHTLDTVELSADEFRHLIQDEWDWTREFVVANSLYSQSTRGWAASKGYAVDEDDEASRL